MPVRYHIQYGLGAKPGCLLAMIVASDRCPLVWAGFDAPLALEALAARSITHALYTNMSFRHVFLLEAVWRAWVRVATGLAHRFLIR